ncbi:farnesol dehydrogenase-like [Toxorhynchites rutilus septentrionalis]|uniref:farnesol dehydrogenase-like n=1 Tax=Toxorhynchites rutilus septentrionalis TaxID=329112 RepID=UPI00247902A1|nr:farnesol dehydrogenase-like [Toxorhynchites rutilus septentrionalis]
MSKRQFIQLIAVVRNHRLFPTMDRWTGKVAVVTGASSGIGAATAKELAKAGMVVIGLARRVERIEALKQELDETVRQRLHAMHCDVTKEESILATFRSIEETFGGVDVLINNAGLASRAALLEPGNTDKLRVVIDTNVMGLTLCSREAFQSMKNRSADGHIVHINSVVGHTVLNFPGTNIYSASKFAVTALTETMRHELRAAGTKIKVTSISPGAVNTEALGSDWDVSKMHMLEPVDIADAVLYVLGTPPRVQVHELMIKSIGK